MTEVAPKPTAVKAATPATYAPITSMRLFPVSVAGPVLFDAGPTALSLPFTLSCASTRHIFLGFVSCGPMFSAIHSKQPAIT
jgi:hypothetical protein